MRKSTATRFFGCWVANPSCPRSSSNTSPRVRELGNATPLISIEGREMTSDVRRGNKEVFNRTARGLDHCLRAGLLTGVATSVCQSNIDELLTEQWLNELIARGVH